jgi:hypothetical protein
LNGAVAQSAGDSQAGFERGRAAVNYYDYFTDIEEHFQRRRGVQVFVSPLDWALMDSWKQAGIPLQAVLAGIDKAFEKFESGRRKDRDRPRALVYCAAAVLDAAEALKEAEVGAARNDGAGSAKSPEPVFTRGRLADYLEKRQAELLAAPVPPEARSVIERSAATLARVLGDVALGAATENAEAGGSITDVEELERLLTVLDEQIRSAIEQHADAELLAKMRAEMQRELGAHRRKLRTEQLLLIERQFLQRRLLDHYALPRLSLFYMK